MVGASSYNSIDERYNHEMLSEILEIDQSHKQRRIASSERRVFFRVGIVAFVIMIFMTVILQSPRQSTILGQFLLSNPSTIGRVHLEASNMLTRENPLSIAHPWKIVEPHRTTRLEAHSSTLGLLESQDKTTCYFEVDGAPLSSGSCIVEAIFSTTGSHTITLTVERSGEIQTYTEEVACKYVRREFRALPEEEKEAFLNALETLYRISQEEGEKIYGPRYKGMAYFVRKHLKAGADISCDHWHDSAAVMTSHSAFTLELEQALQVVDPTVSVPYWDYIADLEKWSEDFLLESEIFNPEYFGSPSPGGDSHIVREGRWAYTEIEKEENNELASVTSPYKILRSPWNMNPHPYLTRATNLYGVGWDAYPSCSLIESMFSTNELASFIYDLNGLSHGPIHIATGGAWNHPNSKLIGELHANGHNILYAKHLWRTGFMRCPATCSLEDSEECECSCPSEIVDKYTPYDILHYETHILHWMEQFGKGSVSRGEDDRFHLTDFAPEDEEGMWGKILDALCNPGFVGEMYTSASPNDPLFWIIHPTIERVWFWKKLNSDLVPYKDEWGYKYGRDPSDTGTVCHWEKVQGLEMPDCQKEDCPGKGEFDEISFSNFIGTDNKYYTNREYLDFAVPTNIDLPYTYDNFQFSYCDEENETSILNVYGELQ
mmetsp:Transcript_15798/g.20250  ORF Transcript_15798/g.20250 Transcript_15798/m.20250 type:complete len:660 (-) Transcript_15798:367-2346(-)